MSDGKMEKATIRWKKIVEYLKIHDYIMNADVRNLCGVSAATVNRILANLFMDGILIKCQQNGHLAYKLSATNAQSHYMNISFRSTTISTS